MWGRRTTRVILFVLLPISEKSNNKKSSTSLPSTLTQMGPRYFLRKEDLEEEQKAIVDGADALLSLAGINNNNNNSAIRNSVKLSTINDSEIQMTSAESQ